MKSENLSVSGFHINLRVDVSRSKIAVGHLGSDVD